MHFRFVTGKVNLSRDDMVMGSPRHVPWLCLHLFVSAKSDGVDGHGEPELHTW